MDKEKDMLTRWAIWGFVIVAVLGAAFLYSRQQYATQQSCISGVISQTPLYPSGIKDSYNSYSDVQGFINQSVNDSEQAIQSCIDQHKVFWW